MTRDEFFTRARASLAPHQDGEAAMRAVAHGPEWDGWTDPERAYQISKSYMHGWRGVHASLHEGRSA